MRPSQTLLQLKALFAQKDYNGVISEAKSHLDDPDGLFFARLTAMCYIKL